ncbi:hypothetical protein [Mucilaginibacter sp.]|uniref:hypothetical protein n=1 Tax=Mucilaginibacter sp. TaxID=1882438 RepID=UPI003D0D07E6
MEWYQYLAAFFAGAFLANSVPHFVYGIAGDKFPTPFSKPRGIGLSSPTLNVVWALFNMVIGYLLFRSGHVSDDSLLPRLTCFAGVAAMSIQLSIGFQRKHKA